MSQPVSIETRVSRNTNDLEAPYGLIQEFAGRTRASFAKVNQRFDDLEAKFVDLETRFRRTRQQGRRPRWSAW